MADVYPELRASWRIYVATKAIQGGQFVLRVCDSNDRVKSKPYLNSKPDGGLPDVRPYKLLILTQKFHCISCNWSTNRILPVKTIDLVPDLLEMDLINRPQMLTLLESINFSPGNVGLGSVNRTDLMHPHKKWF